MTVSVYKEGNLRLKLWPEFKKWHWEIQIYRTTKFAPGWYMLNIHTDSEDIMDIYNMDNAHGSERTKQKAELKAREYIAWYMSWANKQTEDKIFRETNTQIIDL